MAFSAVTIILFQTKMIEEWIWVAINGELFRYFVVFFFLIKISHCLWWCDAKGGFGYFKFYFVVYQSEFRSPQYGNRIYACISNMSPCKYLWLDINKSLWSILSVRPVVNYETGIVYKIKFTMCMYFLSYVSRVYSYTHSETPRKGIKKTINKYNK